MSSPRENGVLRDVFEFKDEFRGYSREWISKSWVTGSYLGIDFCFEDLHAKIKSIEDNTSYLNGFGSFWMSEGFLVNFIKLKDFKVILNPTEEEIQKVASQFNLIVLLDNESHVFQKLKEKYIPKEHSEKEIFLFQLESSSPNNILFIVAKTIEQAQKLFNVVKESKSLLATHEILKGWSMCASGRYMITPLPRHPAKLISDALRLGCRWAFFVGPNEDLAVSELVPKIKEVGLDFVVLSGQLSGDGKALMLGWNTYPDPQSSDIIEACRMKDEKGGLLFGVFGNLLDSDMDILKSSLDGYAFHEGNSEYIEEMKVPFLVLPHHIEWGELPPSMWLFVDKDDVLSLKDRVKKAILSNKAVGVFGDGKIVGPSFLVNVVKMLIMDKVYLRRTFGSDLSLLAMLEGNQLKILVENKSESSIEGVLEVKSTSGITIEPQDKLIVSIKEHEVKEVTLAVKVNHLASGSYGLILVSFSSGNRTRNDLCYIEVPPFVSTLPFLVSDTQKLEVPITIWNSSESTQVNLNLKVVSYDKEIARETKQVRVAPYEKYKVTFPVTLSPGEYSLEFSCLSHKAVCKVLVQNFKGKAFAYSGDFDKDGLEEAILENEFVRAKVISPGGRLLEYTLKGIEAELLFKLFPKKPEDWRVPGRKRRFYPFGGLEEFIQQPTVEGHEKFKVQILSKEGSSASVSVEANMNRNVLKKTFTLFGGSPLLEVRYEADFTNPELNVIGINPLIRIGNNIDASHVFYFPTKDGIIKERYKNRLYGKRFNLSENWVAAFDEQEKVGLIMAYDKNIPFLTHLWMNTPENSDSHYSYAEVQPWIKVNVGTTTYFSYYLYGFIGSVKVALESLKKILPLN
ncbi:MAG: hypothetical protein ACPLRT_03425 [Thermoproteota archaeon]